MSNMNKKIEDIKINKKILRVEPEYTKNIDLDNHNPTHLYNTINQDTSNKYEFLDKRVHKMSQTPVFKTRKHSFNKKIFIFFILSLIVGSLYLLSTTFLHAKITIVAKNQTFDLKDQKFTASKTKTNSVPFEIMSVSDSEFKDIVLTNSKEVNDKAKGEIILYNEFSTTSQKIIAGSFVSDENGKTYKTDTTVLIPGYTVDKTKNITPGQISVGITAFLPGDAYNGNPKSFSLNSFKSSVDKFKKIYGKVKTPLTGGVTGLVYILSDQEKGTATASLNNLKEKLLRKLIAQVPDGYILYQDGMVFTSETDNNIFSKSPSAKLETKGSLSAVILKQSELSDAVVNRLLPDISKKERSEIKQPDVSTLTFNFSDPNQAISKDMTSFDFKLTGALPVYWKPYTEEIKTTLLNKNKTEVPSIFKQDPGIVSAVVKIIPFWSKNLPKDLNNINIILK